METEKLVKSILEWARKMTMVLGPRYWNECGGYIWMVEPIGSLDILDIGFSLGDVQG